MPIDWKSRMLEASAGQGLKSHAAARSVVETALHNGAGIDDVQKFAAQQPALSAVVALFADGFDLAAVSKKMTHDALGGDVRTTRVSSGGGFRLHAVRVDPQAALPWFHKVQGPALPAALVGTGADVVVDGERFSATDVASMLRAA